MSFFVHKSNKSALYDQGLTTRQGPRPKMKGELGENVRKATETKVRRNLK